MSMEDAHIAELRFNGNDDEALFAVFDGHGGEEVALLSRDRFSRLFRGCDAYAQGEYGEAIQNTFYEIDKYLHTPQAKKELQRLKRIEKRRLSGNVVDDTAEDDEDDGLEDQSTSLLGLLSRNTYSTQAGCTAVVVHIKGKTLTVGHVGDSRAVLCEGTQGVALTEDHSPSVPREVQRISDAGGVVMNGRVNGNLNLTRSLGDLMYKADSTLDPSEQLICAKADLKTIELSGDEQFLILACDGIWEVLSNQEACDFVRPRLRKWRQGQRETEPRTVKGDEGVCGLNTRISHIVGDMLDTIVSPSIDATGGVGGDNMSCIVVDLKVDDLADHPDEEDLYAHPPNKWADLNTVQEAVSDDSPAEEFE